MQFWIVKIVYPTICQTRHGNYLIMRPWDTLFHSLYVPGIEVFNTSMVPGHDFLFLLNRQLWFCGEVVTTCLLDRSVKMFPWMRFVNLYSISEAHDVAGSDLSEYYKSQVGKKLES